MYLYRFSIPVVSWSDELSLFEFHLESYTYPSKEYVCNFLYGLLVTSNFYDYNKIMSVIDIIRNNYSDMSSKTVLHTQKIWVKGRGNLVMSIRRV